MLKVDKNGKNIKDEMKENSDKASMLFPDLSQYNIESENSIYGKNDAVGKMGKIE
ncbi:hypothetical protein ACFP3I_25215 [Chryseobacterium arachidis]|uniref:hypothetical protein n=1 Tax=Chryseobacterium arachidis TaxID=1416778 RepID=UPI00360657D9